MVVVKYCCKTQLARFGPKAFFVKLRFELMSLANISKC